MSDQKENYYELLCVASNASDDEIKISYRRLAMKWHPDRNQDNPQAEEKFKKIKEAYEVLSEPNKRAAYDRFGHQEAPSSQPKQNTPDDIFRDIFGSGGAYGGFRGTANQTTQTPESEFRNTLRIADSTPKCIKLTISAAAHLQRRKPLLATCT